MRRALRLGVVLATALGLGAAAAPVGHAQAPQRIVAFTPFESNILARLGVRPTAIGNPPIDGRDVFTRVADEITGLRAIITANLHRRKCHDCGHVGWYADSRTPYCLCDRCCSWLCDRCRSWDTRRVKEAQ